MRKLGCRKIQSNNINSLYKTALFPWSKRYGFYARTKNHRIRRHDPDVKDASLSYDKKSIQQCVAEMPKFKISFERRFIGGSCL